MNPLIQFAKSIWDAGGKFLLAIPFGGAALFSQYDALRVSYPTLPKLDPWWAYATLVVFGWIILGFAIRETKRSLAQPRLYLANPQVQKVPVHSTELKNGEIVIHTVYPLVASVFLHNAPDFRQSQSRLDRAHVTLKFFDMDSGNLVKTLPFGRWADNTQLGHPDSPSSVDPIRYRDIEPNDGPNRIDIALKYEEDLGLSAFLVALRTADSMIQRMSEEYEVLAEAGDQVIQVQIAAMPARPAARVQPMLVPSQITERS